MDDVEMVEATLGKFTSSDIARLFIFPSVQHFGDVESLCRDGSDEKKRNDVDEDHLNSLQER
jgi:hypothetical protein